MFAEFYETLFVAENIVDPTFEMLGSLRNATAAREYANQNSHFIRSIYDAYNQVLVNLGALTAEEQKIMPQTQAFLAKLGLIPLPPHLLHIFVYPLWTGQREPDEKDANKRLNNGLEDLVKMMKDAEGNGLLLPNSKQPDNQVILFGIRVNNPQAYLVGLGGHLLERKLLNTLPAKPGQNWIKDDFLHAVNEVLLLEEYQGQSNMLYQYFSRSNAEGGLGWISPEKDLEFTEAYQAAFD